VLLRCGLCVVVVLGLLFRECCGIWEHVVRVVILCCYVFWHMWDCLEDLSWCLHGVRYDFDL